MTGKALGPRGFLELYDSTLEKAEERLRRFVDDPTAANLHSVRASARRIETMIALMPKRVRKRRAARAYSKALRRVSKISSEAGDCDTVIALLGSDPPGDPSARLISGLEARRAELDRKATAAVRRLLGCKPPRPREGDLDARRLRDRYSREIASCLREGREDYRVARSDPRRKKEFHRMRRRFRDLRYLLRLSEGDPQAAKPLKALISLQDSLGQIRDLDVLLELPHDGIGAAPRPLVRGLQARRAALYGLFLKSAPDTLEALGSIG